MRRPLLFMVQRWCNRVVGMTPYSTKARDTIFGCPLLLRSAVMDEAPFHGDSSNVRF